VITFTTPIRATATGTASTTALDAATLARIDALEVPKRVLFVANSISDRTAMLGSPPPDGAVATTIGGGYAQRRVDTWVTITTEEAMALVGQVAALSGSVDQAAAAAHISPGREWAFGLATDIILAT